MNYDHFIGQVQNRARLSSREAAVTAIRATLEALALRLSEDGAAHLAAQLPKEIGEYIRVMEGNDTIRPERLTLTEFFELVAAIEGVPIPRAEIDARVALQVAAEAISNGELRKLEAQLPASFKELLEDRTEIYQM